MTKNVLNATIAACIVLSLPVKAGAVENKYQITDAEMAACGPDAISLCGDVGQNEDKLLSCMRSKRTGLSTGCRAVFDEGLLRRGLR